MAKVNIPTAPTLLYTNYSTLLGADFSCDPTECNERRSPDTLNMISDNGGNPVKRLGWRVKGQTVSNGTIKNLYIENDTIYAISDTGIYKIQGNESTIIKSFALKNSEVVKFNSKVYVFAGGLYERGGIYEIDGDIKNVLDDPYVPEVTISRKPDGTAGTFLESINLLTPKRRVSFLGDSSSTVYNFVPKSDQTEDKYKYVVADSIKVEVQDSNGAWQENTAYTKPSTVTVTGLNQEGVSQTFTVCAPYITFTSAHAPVVTGQDNVRITYATFDATEENGVMKGQYKKELDMLINAKAVKAYGYIATDRLFAVVDKTKIYYSDVNRVDYFPDDNYITVGNDGEIVGLHRVGKYLVAIKNEISVESTIYLINGDEYDGATIFSVNPAIGGIGAISSGSFATLVDEPLFLSNTGVYAISNSWLTSEKVLRNRSAFLDKKLCKEPNLEKAVATVWNRYYILAVNGHAYVLDGRKKSSDKRNNTDYVYESYYWENIPATAFFVYNNELWFGTKGGKICKFNTDVEGITAYCDNGTQHTTSDGHLTIVDGEAIHCRWSTPLDNDKYPQYFKTLNKKGTVLSLMPYDRSSVTVYYSKDGEPRQLIGTATVDIFNWENIDFERFTFNSNSSVQDMYTRKKIKKYKRLQFIMENDSIYEPFGIIGLTKTYTIGNFAK